MTRRIQYITDSNGGRIAVILPIEEYEDLLGDFHLIAAAYRAKDELTRPVNDLVEELRAAGEIDL